MINAAPYINPKFVKFRWVCPVFLLLGSLLFISSCKPKKEEKKVDANSEEALTNAINEDSTNASLYFKRSELFLAKNNLGGAAQDIDRAVNLDSTKANYYLHKSNVYFALNRTSVTKRCLEKAISLDTTFTEAILKLAELYLYVDKNQESINLINKALRVDKKISKAYFLKAINQLQLRDTSGAVSNLKTCIEVDQDYYHAYVQLANLYSERNNPIALQYYQTALNLNPKSDEVFYGIAMFHLNNKNSEEAAKNLNLAISVNPQNSDAQYGMGYIACEFTKKYSEAITFFDNAIQADRTNIKALYMKALCYERLKDKANAVRYFKEALDMNPTYEKARVGLQRVSS